MFSAKNMQKPQYLQGFCQKTQKRAKTTIFTRFSTKTCKNHCIYEVFCNKRSKTTIFTRFSATHMQKQQYLQGFLQKTCKNSNIYKVFCTKHKNVQKQQYLWGFLRKTCKNNNIYKVFCNTHAKTAIFIRFSATSVQKHQYLVHHDSSANRACADGVLTVLS